MGDRGFVYILTCFATIGGLLFGYDTGIVSGSMILIRKDFSLSTTWQEAIVSGTIGAAAVSSLLAGVLNDVLGRKKVILAASFIFTAGAVVMGAAVDKYMLLAGRLVVGIAIGFAAMTVPVYVAEAAPADIRGRLVTVNQLFITIGIVISSLLAGAFSKTDGGWKYMLGLGGVPSVVQFIGFLYLPESPRWLVQKGRIKQAEEVLIRIRRQSAAGIKPELDDIRQTVDKDKEESQYSFALAKIVATPHVLKAVFIGCGLQLFQQLCGINTVIYYSASILQMAGFPDDQAIWLACIPNAVNFLCTFIGFYLVEKAGRKILLVASMIGVMLSCIVLAVGFQLQLAQTPSINSTLQIHNYPATLHNDTCFDQTICDACVSDGCGFCFVEGEEKMFGGACMIVDKDSDDHIAKYGDCSNKTVRDSLGIHWASNWCPTDVAWITILGVALYVMSFAPGMGPMPWTINSEIYPLWARSTGNALATGTNWIFNLLVSFTFLTLLEAATKHGTFYIFAGVCLIGTIFFIVFVPETKNKTLEEVEMLFMTPEKRKESSAAKYAYNNEGADTKM